MPNANPTAAAMRAAQAIWATDNLSRADVARLIDRETGLPQLAEALELIDLAPLSHGDEAVNEMQRLARAALAVHRRSRP